MQKMASINLDNTLEDNKNLSKDLEKLRLGKRYGRGQTESGLTHECGVFGCIAVGDWPTSLEISQIICWGLVALQHRYVSNMWLIYFEFKLSKMTTEIFVL